MLDEFGEDTKFLAFAVLSDHQTPDHREYLVHFYEEDEDKRKPIPRRNIRDYVTKMEAKLGAGNSERLVYLSRKIYSGYSRFVHGRSTHVMDMYFGSPPRFHLHGTEGTLRQEEHRYDLYNPFFNSIIAFAVAAKAFGEDELCNALHEHLHEFDKLSGRNEAFRGGQS